VWLTGYAELYKRTGDIKYIELIDNYLIDYNNSFADPFDPHITTAYDEATVSVRANHLAFLYLNIYRNRPESERYAIESLIDKDMKLLQVYLDQEYWDNKNHGIMQARSALNLVVIFPFYEEVDSLESSIERRFTAISEQLFSYEGFVVEQSTGYHFIGISMMLEARLQLMNFGMEPNAGLDNKLRKAIAITPFLLYQNGTTPAIGDSVYGKVSNGYVNRYYAEFGETIAELESYLESRHENLDDLKVITDEGLIIAKYNAANGEMSKIFFDAGKPRLIHGHYDHLNILASLEGEPFLVDSGGPYTYSVANGRDRWRYRSAHNMLVASGDEVGDFESVINGYFNTNTEVSASGTVNLTKDVVHHRGFVLTKEKQPILIVVDIVEPTDDPISIDQYWHFAPETKIQVIDESHNILTLISGKNFQQYKIYNGQPSCRSIEGTVDENNMPLMGWVTHRYNDAKPSLVLKCSVNSSNYFSITVFTEKVLTHKPSYSNFSDKILITVDNKEYIFSLKDNLFVQ